jgi:hypothetical protein
MLSIFTKNKTILEQNAFRHKYKKYIIHTAFAAFAASTTQVAL